MYLRARSLIPSFPRNQPLFTHPSPRHLPGGLPPRPAPALHQQAQRWHTMAYWDPWTGAPSQELMDIAEHWHKEGRAFETIDEAHIRTLAPSALVVEVGPGLGGDLRALSNAVPFGQVVVLEQCPVVLGRLSHWFAARSNVRFVQGQGLESLDLSPGRVDYLRLVRVAPYLSEAELGRLFARACTLLGTHGALFMTVCHPGTDAHADMAIGQGFGHHTLAAVLRIAGWHSRLRLDRLALSVKDTRTRTPLQYAVLDLSHSHPEALDHTVLALVDEHRDRAIEIEMRLWFAKDEAPPREP